MKNKASKIVFKKYSVIFALAICAAKASLSQTQPSTGDILRETQRAVPSTAAQRPSPSISTSKPDQVLAESGPAVLVRRFVIEGSTVWDAQTLAANLDDLVGKKLTMVQLQAAADRLTLVYREHGRLAIALLPEQPLDDGVLRIVVVEAKLGQQRVEQEPGSAPVPLDLAKAVLSRGQQHGQLVDLRLLDQANLILGDVPGVKVQTTLQPGAQPEQTDVLSVVSALPIFSGNTSFDLNDARTTGRERVSVGLVASNAMGWGEQTTLALQKTQGKEFALLGYSHPLHASGTRIALSVGSLKYHLTNGSQVTGDAGTWSVTLNQPLVRSESFTVSSSLAFNRIDSNTQSATSSNSQVGSTALGFSGNWSDLSAGGGVNNWSLLWSEGNESRTDQTKTETGFRKWAYNALRLQQLGARGNLLVSVNGQWTGSALPSSETFSLGGANGVRAYPIFEGNGDRGWVGTFEYRRDLSGGHTLKAFYDYGRIHKLSTSSGPAQYALKGGGVGWDVTADKNLQIKTSVAWRIGTNPYPSSNGQDADGSLRKPQFWLNAVYTF